MGISKLAVTKYLDESKRLRDSENAKKLAASAVAKRLRKIGATFVTRPYLHQSICFLLGWYRESYLFLLGMGGGKTKISLDLCSNLISKGKAARALVLVPNVTNIEAWCDEGVIHSPHLSVVGITMSGREERADALLNAGQVVVMTYQGFVSLVCDTVERKGKRKWAKNDRRIDELASRFDVLVLDECTAIKRHTSLHFRVCRRLCRRVQHRYGLTGTPFDKNPIDLWSQFYAIDLGETLGETIGLFRAAYFREKQNYWGGSDYEFRRRLDANLARRLRNRSIRYREEECQDLPACVGGLDGESWMIRSVVMPEENWAYYERLLKDLQDSRDDYQLLEGVYMRMRMLASGYLALKDDLDRIEITFEQNPKLDALKSLLSEIPEDEKVIVCHVFRKSGDVIAEMLRKEKIPFAAVHGGVKDKRAQLRKFRDGNARVMVGSQSIAYGLNLQTARYMIFYESPDSTIARRQTERRIRRRGAKGRCYYWDICVRQSIELRILKALKDGKRLLDLLMDRRKSAGEMMMGYKRRRTVV